MGAPSRVMDADGPSVSSLGSVWANCGYSYLFSSSWATQYSLLQFAQETTSLFAMNPEARAALREQPALRLGLRLLIHRKFDAVRIGMYLSISSI